MRAPARGYNHDVRYRGRLFHVQSEVSSGLRRQACTQLFAGGTVLATERSAIAEAMSDADIDELLRSQHKAVLRKLCHGAFDAWIQRGGREDVEPAKVVGGALDVRPSGFRFIPPPIPR